MDNNIWFSNINVLFNKEDILKIVPSYDMINAEKINAITRFALYLSILLYLVSGNYLYFYIILGIIVITYLVYIFNGKEFFKEVNDEEDIESDSDSEENVNNVTNTNEVLKDCKKPSYENPLMNPLIGDNPFKNKKACSLENNNIVENIDKRFCNKLYQNTSSIFSNRMEQRPFYTMPNSRIPNDQGSFANWLYKTPVSCAVGESGLLKQYRSCAFNHTTLDENKMK